MQVLRLVQTQCMMMIFVAVGFLCRKTDIINETSEKSLVTAIINIVLPATIFNAMLTGLEQVDWQQAGVTVAICISLHLFAYALGLILFRRFPADRKAVCVFGLLVNNAAFVGLPLVSSIYGASGIFYTTIFMTISRIFMWGPGFRMFPGADKRNPVIVVLTNPNTISMLLALGVYYLLPFSLPAFLLSAISEIGSTSTVFCMAMVGSLLPGLTKRDLCNPVVLFYSAIRLLLLPLCVFAVLSLLGVDKEITGVLTLLASAPGPTTGSVLASKYQGDKKLAATLALVSTVFSAITLPAMALLYS